MLLLRMGVRFLDNNYKIFFEFFFSAIKAAYIQYKTKRAVFTTRPKKTLYNEKLSRCNYGADLRLDAPDVCTLREGEPLYDTLAAPATSPDISFLALISA